MSGSVDITIVPKQKDLGEFTVRRSLPDARRKMIGPFIFFDHMGPAVFAPGSGVNVRAHPHIGIATITYLFDGVIRHRDSLGFDQEITPGAVNWMTTGRGIVHSERTPPGMKESGSTLHGIQSWVALPADAEECPPAFDHYPATDIPAFQRDGARGRVVLGGAFGQSSPVRTASDTLYVDVSIEAGAVLQVDADAEEQGLYIVEGEVVIEGEAYSSGTMVVLNLSARPKLEATVASRLMLLGGAAADGRRNIWWNFVSSSKARIEQAKADWREGRFGLIDGESEFIPLPED